jgi:hypothetical protein
MSKDKVFDVEFMRIKQSRFVGLRIGYWRFRAWLQSWLEYTWIIIKKAKT